MLTPRLATIAVHAARGPDPATGGVARPIHLTTTCERTPDDICLHGWVCGRTDNPLADLRPALAVA